MLPGKVEITDALSAVGDKGHRVAIFEEPGKHQHAHAWHSGPDLKRRAEPVVGVIRRHLDIGDNDVRTSGTCYPHNVASILRGADDLEAVVLQDVHDAFPENRLVLTDDYADLPWPAHGINICDHRARTTGGTGCLPGALSRLWPGL